MIYFLITCSFILHLLTIFAVIILFQKRSLERVDLPSPPEDTETIHKSMAAFVDELEKENEALYEKLVHYIKSKEEEWDRKIDEEFQKKVEPLNRKLKDWHQQMERLEQTAEHDEKRPSSPQHVLVNEEKKDQQTDKLEMVAQLHEQGFSKEQIAKMLRIGNGETALMIHMLPSSRRKKTKS